MNPLIKKVILNTLQIIGAIFIAVFIFIIGTYILGEYNHTKFLNKEIPLNIKIGKNIEEKINNNEGCYKYLEFKKDIIEGMELSDVLKGEEIPYVGFKFSSKKVSEDLTGYIKNCSRNQDFINMISRFNEKSYSVFLWDSDKEDLLPGMDEKTVNDRLCFDISKENNPSKTALIKEKLYRCKANLEEPSYGETLGKLLDDSNIEHP